MANYQNLKAAIDQVIKANGQKEITGPVLNDTLKAMVNSLGAGYQFRGVATPSTNPGTPDQNVFYLAGQAGTYTNFNSIVLPDGVSIIKWNGSWSSETIATGDGVFDISAYKATGGTLATFADLSAALDDGNNIPQPLRKGGMSVKFVQSSDNKYVRYNLLATSFTTDTTQWAIDDAGVYVNNPEFVEMHTDGEGKIAYGVKDDGDFYFGAGIPSQIKKAINEINNTKVNKKPNKSLIDDDFAEEVPGIISVVANPEWLNIDTDSDGKILSGRKKDGTKVENTDVEYPNGIPSIIAKMILPLKDKTVAILGDSIMEFMGGDVPSGNVITLYNYDDPSDTTVYQSSDMTVVNGIMYLTSSLSGGEVTENSIRLDIKNSEQEYIDSRGWELVKNNIGAKDIINCGQGGGTFPEMGITTAYPSTTLSGVFGDKTQSFPNQVKMLKRLVSNGDYDAPDCIVIWMGINGTAALINDTLSEAMALDWETLSDDVAGYNYRTKYYAAIRYGIESLYRAFPDALIVMFSPVMTDRGNLDPTGTNPERRGYDDLKVVSAALQSIAERYSCMFFDALTQIGVANFAYKQGDDVGNLIPRYLKDGLHPSEAGKIVWGNYLSRILNSFYFDKK